jgi:cytochrome c oxidase subunit 2
MNRNVMMGIGGLVVLVLLVGGFMIFQGKSTPQPSPQPDQLGAATQATQAPEMSPMSEASSSSESAMEASGSAEEGVKQFTVTGSNFKFEPNTLTVKKGDKVKIIFNNAQGFHDFVLPDFKVQTKPVGANQPAIITFTADKAGTFQYYCSVGNHKAMGMVGTLTVQ